MVRGVHKKHQKNWQVILSICISSKHARAVSQILYPRTIPERYQALTLTRYPIIVSAWIWKTFKCGTETSWKLRSGFQTPGFASFLNTLKCTAKRVSFETQLVTALTTTERPHFLNWGDVNYRWCKGIAEVQFSHIHFIQKICSCLLSFSHFVKQR